MLALAAFMTTSSVAAPSTTASQLTKRFKTATGEKLVRNAQISYAGHYVAYDLGVPTPAKKAEWGTFSVHLITGADVETEATDLLKNSRTGTLGQPTSAGIYWEAGTSIYGQPYFQAKKRYGQNVVLKWISPSGKKKLDASWKRIHTALTKSTK
jgi:predicted proteasome-type protease